MMTRGQPAWKYTLAMGAAAVGGYFTLPGDLPKDVGYQLIGLASVAAIIGGVHRHRPAKPRPGCCWPPRTCRARRPPGERFRQHRHRLRRPGTVASLRGGRLQGFEALARWRHPTKGEVPPAVFIPIAEETGLILPLGRRALETACLQAATWPVHDGQPPTISVNLSGRQLQDRSLLDDVRTTLAFSAIPARQLILEVTESMLMDDPENAAAILTTVKSLGVRLAVDDFGTGYSSLSYLRQFPVDVLKIDKTFVDPLTDATSEDTTFVKTIIRLAHDLHLTTTAEGIEDCQQRDTLTALDCDTAQGCLLSRPLDRAAARQLAQGTRLAVA